MPLGGAEIVIVVLWLFLLFGAKKFPAIGRSLGLGMRELKESITDGDEDKERSKNIDITVPARTESDTSSRTRTESSPPGATTDAERVSR